MGSWGRQRVTWGSGPVTSGGHVRNSGLAPVLQGKCSAASMVTHWEGKSLSLLLASSLCSQQDPLQRRGGVNLVSPPLHPRLHPLCAHVTQPCCGPNSLGRPEQTLTLSPLTKAVFFERPTTPARPPYPPPLRAPPGPRQLAYMFSVFPMILSEPSPWELSESGTRSRGSSI